MNTNKAQANRFGSDASVNVWDDDREVTREQASEVKDYSGGYIVK